MQKHPMTKEGADRLQAELNRLKKEERPRITQAIADAREHGDLKENAEYHAAREQQGMNEARIKYIEGVLGNVQIIDVTQLQAHGKIVFGATVKLLNIDTDAEVCYRIVGNEEADVKENKISINSPIARALIGKVEGDEVVVQAPSGDIDYEILEVLYV
ncbi:transcription elongation factor GreA [Thiomicrospira microaerophila]|uniref:transcription elongation factor GreA n=1 Tax=Thiomicrospira microaerophila TaxID=406020 RepID=UPI00200CCB83|nr:transcription elongation factor GreA [Thiomicrospira microaerophila]UQB43209.1 transcription elongation factor GreA [Thiomicrospira microaerophila]